MNKSKHIITEDTIVINHDGKVYNLNISEQKNSQKIISACLKKNYTKAISFIDFKIGIENETNGEIKHVEGKLTYNGEGLPEHINNIVRKLYEEGSPIDPVINFWNRLKENPTQSAKDTLLEFIKHNDIRLTDDGFIIGYKYVSNNPSGKGYVDSYTKSIPNIVGEYVTMNRDQVVCDPHQTCSAGLHVGAWEYVRSHDHVLEVLVDPIDVVSVPIDYHGQKMRCCRYKILRDVSGMKYEDVNKTQTKFGIETTSDQTKQEQQESKVEYEEVLNEKTKITEFAMFVKRISEGRLPLNSKIISQAGFKPDSIVYVNVKEKEIIISSKNKNDGYKLKVTSDCYLRISRTILDKISKKNRFRVKVIGRGISIS